MNTKTLRALAAAGALALLAAGCSSGTPSSDSTDSASAGGDTGAASSVTLVTPGKLTVCTNPPFQPFEYTENNQVVGFDMDLTGEVAKDLGVTLEPKATGFDAIESGAALDAGTCDVVASGITINDARKSKIDFSEPYFNDDLGVITKEGSAIKTADDLKGKKVAVQVATTGKDFCEKIGASCVEFEDVGLQVQAVSSGQAEAGINNLSVMASFANEDKTLSIPFTEKSGEQYGIGVKKGNTQLLDQVNKTLTRIKSDGTYDSLYAKYFAGLPTAS